MNPVSDICMNRIFNEPLPERRFSKLEYAVECEASPLNSPLSPRRKMQPDSQDTAPMPPQRLSSINHNQNNISIYMDQGEYYFDEDFSVPFDSNFQGDMSTDSHEMFNNRYYSDPNLLKSHDGSFLNENKKEPLNSSNQGNMSISSADIDLEFSVGKSDFNSSRLMDNQMMNSSQIMDYNAFSTSYMKMLMNQSGYRDLRDLLCRTDPDYAINWNENIGTFRQELQRSISQNDMYTVTGVVGLRKALNEIDPIDKTNKKSIGITARNSFDENGTKFTTTWARVKGSRESLRNHNNKLCGDSITILPPKTKKLPDDGSIGWRAMKDAAANEFTTWGQFKRAAATVRPSRQEEKQKDIFITSQIADATSNLGLNSFVRSRSQPNSLGRNIDMQRFSGTLLEIYMRARTQDENSTNISKINSRGSEELSSKLRPTPISPSLHQISLGHQQTQNDKIRPRGWYDQILTGDDALSAVSNGSIRYQNCNNFGAQFPPSDPDELKALNSNIRYPIWSVLPSNRRFSSGIYNRNRWNPQIVGQRPLSFGYLQPVQNVLPTTSSFATVDAKKRPASSSSTGAMLSRLVGHVATGTVTHLPPGAIQLTESAGPESAVMTGLRKGYPSNPRSIMIDYPGLGVMSIPKISRLTSSSLLSLPDLSFLGQAFEEEMRHGTPTMAKRTAKLKNNSSKKSKNKKHKYLGPHSCICEKCGKGNHLAHGRNNVLKISHKGSELDRSTSEPDLAGTSNIKTFDKDVMITSEIVTVHDKLPRCIEALTGTNTTETTTETTGSDCDIISSGMNGNSLKPKKSVSFSNGTSVESSPDPVVFNHPAFKLIPRNWGLYGQEPPPLAEFRTVSSDNSIKSKEKGNLELSNTQRTDIDIRFAAMVNDVIKAVQETVAHFCQEADRTKENTQSFEQVSYSVAMLNIGSSGKQPLLAVVNPLLVLLSDGLLPPTRPLFASKPRSRLWSLVEESCRPGSCPAGVAYHVLCEAINEVKGLPNTTTDKMKFRVFVCSCLKLKALPMWLNAVVANESLLKRFYCDGAFLRQCRTSQRGLHADLMTHLEQLLAFTFNFQIEIEARKPNLSTLTQPTLSSSGKTVLQPIGRSQPSTTNQNQPRRCTPANSVFVSKTFDAHDKAKNISSLKTRTLPANQSVHGQSISTGGTPTKNPVVIAHRSNNYGFILPTRLGSHQRAPVRKFSDGRIENIQLTENNSIPNSVVYERTTLASPLRKIALESDIPPPLPPHSSGKPLAGVHSPSRSSKFKNSIINFRRSFSNENGTPGTVSPARGVTPIPNRGGEFQNTGIPKPVPPRR